MTTYPASFERYLTNGTAALQITSVVGESGVVPATIDLAASGLASVRFFYVENTADVTASGVADVTVSGAPVNGTVPRGQILLATNDVSGWTAGTIEITGTAGTPFKLIAAGV
jgi:hypothetical protein